MLYDLFPISPIDIDNKDDWHILEGVTLSVESNKKIIDCLFEHHSEDIPEMYEDWLRPPMENNLLKLAERFNCPN